MIVLAFDPGQTATGWAVCDAQEPLLIEGTRAAGVIRPGKKTWTGLLRGLDSIGGACAGVSFAALEVPGTHGSIHGGRETQTVRGVSMAAGACALWAARYGEPWAVEPMTWRRWWGIAGKTRAEGKSAAQALVRAQGWGEHSPDVAEAILLAVGAARNHLLRPK